MNFLLSDEKEISSKDYDTRKMLYEEFCDLPVSFVSKMRHLQPQVGCFNNCSFCSKFSVCKSEYWPIDSLRNIISALKYTSLNYTKDDLLLSWDRREHRVGVIFPYLNNDIAGYLYLDQYIDLCYKELGVRTRISTVGFSRFNERLNQVHKNICSKELLYALGGVRLSVCQYGRVWEEEGDHNSLDDYKKDLANFLQIYRPYYEKFGSGSRKMCVELRFHPLVINSSVLVFSYQKKLIIATGNYLFASVNPCDGLEECHVIDPYKHSLQLSQEGVTFTEYNLDFVAEREDDIVQYLNQKDLKEERKVDVYLFENKDGIYYAINPQLKQDGNYSMNIYPKTDIRKKSGYIITERFFLNALYNFKKKRGYALRDYIPHTSYDDTKEVLDILREYATYYQEIGKIEKHDYILKHVIPLIDIYIQTLQLADYSSDVFFDKNFTIDTGIICNLGRAIHLFKGLTTFVNEPLTPIHERNYGRHCSTMRQENYGWLLGCDFYDTILVEKLDFFNTASTEGQVSFKKKIVVDQFNQKISSDEKYLYPGEMK